jgi:hypothetical protein
MFAHQRRRIADIIKKRLLALVLVIRKPEIFANPKQEGSKRPLGYVYPAAERPSWIALFGGISYSAWAFVAYSCWQGSFRYL